MNIRPATPDDVVGILEIDRSSLTAAHWSEEQYRGAIQPAGDDPDRVVFVAEMDGSLMTGYRVKTHTRSQRVRKGWGARQSGDGSPEQCADKTSAPAELRRRTLVGFLVARHVSEEWELENLVVASAFRGRGFGSQLLRALLARVREAESRGLFLEVRESNAAARKLYQNAGFRETGRRRRYYADPAEDAVLYSKCVG
jgi:ribosomal-protein-alanine acetyltransferase